MLRGCVACVLSECVCITLSLFLSCMLCLLCRQDRYLYLYVQQYGTNEWGVGLTVLW